MRPWTGGGPFGVGALAHLLKNHFYIGEVVYRGDIHRGEHEPIVDSALFAAVQDKLADQAIARRCRLRGSPALLTGRIFDERNNRMSPNHSNKRGVRYRYYASQAVQHNSRVPVSVSRVPAAELEALVTDALRNHLSASDSGQQLPDSDRDLVERHVESVTLMPNEIRVRVRGIVQEGAQELDTRDTAGNSSAHSTWGVRTIAVPWTNPVPASVNGIIHVPAHNTPISPDRREAILIAIATARKWTDELVRGRVSSFAAITRREGKVERYIRLLAPLAFVSPRIVSALLDGTAPADLTVTQLARALPYSWADQEHRVGISRMDQSQPRGRVRRNFASHNRESRTD